MPQLFTSVLRFASHPLLAMPSQSPKPVLQVKPPHVPARQAGVALAKVPPQAIPQAPQFAAVVWRSTQTPLQSV